MAADLATMKAIAEAIGRAPATIRPHLLQAEAEGRLVRTSGLWPKAQAIKLLNDAIDPAMTAGHAAHGRGEGGNAATDSFALSKAAAEEQRALKLRLANEKTAGRLVDRNEVVQAGLDLCVSVRQQMLAIPARISAKVVGLDDIGEVQRLLDGEIRLALQAFADPNSFTDEILGVAK